MPLRGLQHFVPYSRRAQSVRGMIKFLLENSAGSADNVSCISSFSDLRQAKKAVFRLPRGEKRLVSFNKTTARQPFCCDFSLGKQSLRNNLDLLFASCFYLFPCLLIVLFSSVWWLHPQQAAASNVASKLLTRWAASLRQGMTKAGTSVAQARWMFGSVGLCPEQSQHQRCWGGFSGLPTCQRRQPIQNCPEGSF